jgi:hypothetical protein
MKRFHPDVSPRLVIVAWSPSPFPYQRQAGLISSLYRAGNQQTLKS